MDGVYEKLSEKFEAHNQDELAVALRDAKGRLRMCVPATTGETDVGGDEFHAVLLQFLLSLSNSPTNAKGALHYELPHRSSVEDGAPSEEDFDLDDDGLVGSDWTDPGMCVFLPPLSIHPSHFDAHKTLVLPSDPLPLFPSHTHTPSRFRSF